MQPPPAVPVGMPTWAWLGTKPGAGRSTLPLLGQARAGGAGCPPPPPWWQVGRGPGARAGGSVLLGSLHRLLRKAAAPELRKPAPRPAAPPPPPTSSRPASFSSHPPPARFYGNWAMLVQTASRPCTPGDTLLLHGAFTFTVMLVNAQVHTATPDCGEHPAPAPFLSLSLRPCFPTSVQDIVSCPFPLISLKPLKLTA